MPNSSLAPAATRPAPVLLTGATGFIGRWLVPRLTARGHHVTAIVRRARERAQAIAEDVRARGGDPARLTLLEGDLARPQLALHAVDRERLPSDSVVIHLGALMELGISDTDAHAVNTEGTAQLLGLLPPRSLRRFVLISGFRAPYAAALPPAQLGAYERSKLAADALVREHCRAHAVPLTVVQPAVVIGDAHTGETTLALGLGQVVHELARGAMPLIPAADSEWLPLVTVDLVADFLARVPFGELEPYTEYTLLDERTPSFPELVRRIACHMGVAAPRLQLPRGVAARLLRLTGQRVKAEALAFITNDRYDTASARAALAREQLSFPDLDSALRRHLDFLVANHYGCGPAHDGVLMTIADSISFVRGARGSAEVVFLHGLPLDGDSWNEIRAGLPGHAALAPDLPGFGRSAQPTASPLAWMEALLAAQTKPVLLVGHSLGCAYALEYAAAHPARVSGLVLVSPAFVQEPLSWSLRCGLSRGALVRAAPSGRIVGPLRARHGTQALRAAQQMARPGARARLARALGQAQRTRAQLSALLHTVQVPVRIVVGAHDPLVEAVPGADVIVVPESGHFPQLDAPSVLVDALGSLLRGAN
jgi:pimeloyl-ACP methyl ester carboxylesterase/nucleoside-diphosphate-sugar epimerase